MSALKLRHIATCLIPILSGCQTLSVAPQNPKGEAISYSGSFSEIPEQANPNEATLSMYEQRRHAFIRNLISNGNAHTIKPKGNAEHFQTEGAKKNDKIEYQLSNGYLLSYLFYEKGYLKYNSKAPADRFTSEIDDQTLFFTHSTGKSIISYIIGNAICNGYINSIDEKIDWPMMKNTLYQGQSLRNLLNMMAGDRHVVDASSTIVMGVGHHRNMGLDTIADILDGTKSKTKELFYNNFLADVLANYVAYKSGDHYEELLNYVFQEKIKIQHEVHFEKHRLSLTNGRQSTYYGEQQTRASYSFFMTRLDLLRFGIAVMKDYQENTCVGRYLRNIQENAIRWNKYRPTQTYSWLWLHNFSRDYGGMFYFGFQGLNERNIFATEGKNGNNLMIDMDNSRVVVTNSAATGWNNKVFIIDVIDQGKLPR